MYQLLAIFSVCIVYVYYTLLYCTLLYYTLLYYGLHRTRTNWWQYNILERTHSIRILRTTHYYTAHYYTTAYCTLLYYTLLYYGLHRTHTNYCPYSACPAKTYYTLHCIQYVSYTVLLHRTRTNYWPYSACAAAYVPARQPEQEAPLASRR